MGSKFYAQDLDERETNRVKVAAKLHSGETVAVKRAVGVHRGLQERTGMYWDVLYISYSIYMYHRIIIQYIPIYFILYHHSFPASYSEHSNIFNSYNLII